MSEGGSMQKGRSMHGMVDGRNRHSNGFVNGNRDLFNNIYFNGVGLLDGDGIGPVHRHDIGLGYLNLYGYIIGLFNDIWLGYMHDIRARHFNLMRDSVGPLNFDRYGYRNLFRYGHLLMHGHDLLNDLRHWHGLGYGDALVDRDRFVNRHGIRRGHRVSHGHWPGDFVYNNGS